MTHVVDYARENVAELADLVNHVTPASLERLTEVIVAAPRIYFTGVGRSGLAARAVAMRLMHIGKTIFVVGEVATPAIRGGDLLVAVSSSGRGSILNQARSAVDAGAEIAAIVAKQSTELAELAKASLVLPTRTTVPTRQHAGSLFEQGTLVIGDALCRAVQSRLDVPEEILDNRHANLS